MKRTTELMALLWTEVDENFICFVFNKAGGERQDGHHRWSGRSRHVRKDNNLSFWWSRLKLYFFISYSQCLVEVYFAKFVGCSFNLQICFWWASTLYGIGDRRHFKRFEKTKYWGVSDEVVRHAVPPSTISFLAPFRANELDHSLLAFPKEGQ